MWVGSIQTLSTLLLGTIHFLVVADGIKWDVKCTPLCTCDMSYFSDLPTATQWQKQQATPKQLHNNNEATYDDNEQPRGDLLRIAMCVLQEGTDPLSIIETLPKDIQVLTILQGRGNVGTSIEAGYFQDFPDLMVIDIQGFKQEGSKLTDPLVLRNDVFQPIISLKYLNLENIKLLGHIGQDNFIHPLELSQPPPPPPPRNSRKGRREKDSSKRRIKFLQPTDNDIPIISYEEYKQAIERAGLTTFTGLSELLSLRVYSCDLREVNWEMFKGLGKLQHLSLEHNNLLFIPEFAFYGTPHLKTLSLAGNKLLNLQDTALAGLLQLNKLDLSRNQFSHLSELSLPPFPELRTADFCNNPVEAIFPSTFEIMNATYDLYLGGDTPLNLLPNSFLGLTSLKQLHITNVKVPLLERELLKGMPKLQKLAMTGYIQTISFDAFIEVPKLEHLILNKCNITAISMDAFYGLYGLISLDLSHNLLNWLPPGIFDQQFSLRELILNNNQLTELPPTIFMRVPAKMIRLDQNPWHCSCAMSEWQPSAINKVKQRGVKQDGLCQFSYDKGSHCKGVIMDRYVYDKRVAPRCATPQKFSNWNVFHLLRKELHCNKKQKKDRKAYLTKKQEDYEQSVNPQNILNKYRAIDQILDGNDNETDKKHMFNDTSNLNASVPPTQNELAPQSSTNSLQETITNVTNSKNLTANDTRKPQMDEIETPEGDDTSLTRQTQEEETVNNPIHIVPQDTMTTMKEQSTSPSVASTTVTLQSNKINTKLETDDVKKSREEEPFISKKAKQQMALQREKEERAARKEKMKAEMSNDLVREGFDKELKNTLKLEMQKKRMEKLKQVIS